MRGGGLDLALSPYHLTTAEPAAVAALLLGSRVVTMLPRPFGFAGGEDGRVQVREAVERSPGLLRLMESWRWSGPLWDAGVVGSEVEGEGVEGEVQRVWQRILLGEGGGGGGGGGLAPLRGVMRATLYRDQREYLDLVCADLLKGGADPGVGVVIAAGLDAFSVRHGLAAVRAGASERRGSGAVQGGMGGGGGGGGSVWQRAEAGLCRRVFAVGVPVLLRASGKRILAARQRFAGELEELRGAIVACVGGDGGGERVMEAGAAYARAYAAAREEISTGDDEQGVRVQDGFISVTGVRMPADAALRSSLTAVRSLGGRMGRGVGGGGGGAGVGAGPLDGEAGAELFALVVKRMNIRPEGVAAPGPGRTAAI